MKLTNRYNLPEAIYNIALSGMHDCNPDAYSVTEILGSTREILLKRRHHDEIEVDVSDLIPAMFGSAVHKIFEDANTNGEAELKLKINKLSGICDLYHDKVVEDYKTTSVNKVIRQDFEDYRKQAMMYAYMILQTRLEKPEKIRINLLMKDWSKIQSLTRTGYPTTPVYVYEYIIQDSDYDDIADFIKLKLNELSLYESVADNDLPQCSESNRWFTGDKYAVFKKDGDKKAFKVCDSLEEAEALKPEGGKIEKRPGEDLKCKCYCNCSKFCRR